MYLSCGCPKLLPEVSQPCQKSESASLDKSSAGDPFDEGGQPLISVIGRAAAAPAAGRRGDRGGDLRLRRRHIADLS